MLAEKTLPGRATGPFQPGLCQCCLHAWVSQAGLGACAGSLGMCWMELSEYPMQPWASPRSTCCGLPTWLLPALGHTPDLLGIIGALLQFPALLLHSPLEPCPSADQISLRGGVVSIHVCSRTVIFLLVNSTGSLNVCRPLAKSHLVGQWEASRESSLDRTSKSLVVWAGLCLGELAGKGQSTWREVRRGRTGIKLLIESRCGSEEQSAGMEWQGGRGSEGLPHVGWDFCFILRAPSALRARVGGQEHQKNCPLHTRFHHSYPISPQEADPPSTPGLWMIAAKVPCSGPPAVLRLLMKTVSIVFGGVGAGPWTVAG